MTTAIDVNDLAIASQYVCNQALGLPPPRADYLRYAINVIAEKKRPLTAKQILSEFGIADDKRARRVERALKNLTEKRNLHREKWRVHVKPKYVSSWERIKKLTINIGDSLFFTKNTETETASSMKIVKNGKEHWLTTLDIAFLTLFALQMLMEECWKKRILLIGVTKDTAARDFKRQLIPIMHNGDLLKTRINAMLFRSFQTQTA